MKQIFYIEVTDTFCGEANYSWVTRHAIQANTIKGAIWRFSRMSGLNWRSDWDDGTTARYNSKSGATCLFIENYDEDYHGRLRFDTDERTTN